MFVDKTKLRVLKYKQRNISFLQTGSLQGLINRNPVIQ